MENDKKQNHEIEVEKENEDSIPVISASASSVDPDTDNDNIIASTTTIGESAQTEVNPAFTSSSSAVSQ